MPDISLTVIGERHVSPAKQSKRKRGSKTLPVLGAAGLSLSLASTASAAVAVVAAAAEAAVEVTGAGSVVGWFGATDVTCHITSGSP